MKLLRLSLLTLTLVLSVPISSSQAQLKSKVLGYRVENVRVGDRFIYSIVERGTAKNRRGKAQAFTKRKTLTERVIALSAAYDGKEGARKLIRDTVTGTSAYYAETPGVSFAMNEPLGITALRPAGHWRTYPLAIAKGKTIKLPESEQAIDLGSSKSVTKTSIEQRLLGKENVKVEGKNYSCVKVRETVTMTSKMVPSDNTKKVLPKTNKEVRVATLWWSPELGTLLKYQTAQGKQSFTQTLTKYVKAPAETAMVQ
jgi:hypothetical protein